MYPRRFAYAIGGLTLCLTSALLGADLKMTVSRPAEQLLRGRTLLVKSQNGVAFAGLPALINAVNQALSADFTPATADADLTMTLTVTGYEQLTSKPLNASVQRPEMRAGPLGVQIPTGKMITVPVQYWEGRSKLVVQVSVANRSNAAIDSFSPQAEYYNKIETVEAGKRKEVQLPTRPEVDSALAQKIVSDIRERYGRTTETVQVWLSSDKSLDAGLKLAERGEWKQALEEWSRVKSPGKEDERTYNMAVANEALFYAADYVTNPQDGEAMLQEAVRLYAEALRLNPRKKEFQRGSERSAELQANFTKAREQWAILQRERELLEASARPGNFTGPGAKAVADAASSDSADEADFREIVRTRLRSRNDKPPADYTANLEKTGTVSYKLQPDQAKRIVGEEIENWDAFHHNRTEYRQMLSEFTAKDKTLDARERDSLNRFATRTQLTKEDIGLIEAEFKFTDLTRTASPAR
jgi:hypothetical protein